MAKGDQVGGSTGVFPGLYKSAIEQTGEDYDSIMSQYKNLASSGRPSSSLAYSPISPAMTEYTPGNNHNDLRRIASTGGLSGTEISDIRARDAAPVRSIFASGQRELARRTNLQGGYSPNAGAVSAKMARDLSSMIGDRTSASNANIAELTSRNKLAAATSLAPLDARENEFRNNMNMTNAASTNRANEFNANSTLQYHQANKANEDNDFENIFRAIQGQAGLYGTTPALANTFGSQVLNASNTVSGFPGIGAGSLSRGNPNSWMMDKPQFRKNATQSGRSF